MLDNNPVEVAMDTDDHDTTNGQVTPPGTPPMDSMPNHLAAPQPVLSPLSSTEGSMRRQSLRSTSSVTSLRKGASVAAPGNEGSLIRKASLTKKDTLKSYEANHDNELESQISRSSIKLNSSVSKQAPNESLARRSSTRSQRGQVEQENRENEASDTAEETGTNEEAAGAANDNAEEAQEDMDTSTEPPATAGPSAAAPSVYMGPPPIEIAISFDTTGSMSQCIEQVQAQVGYMIERLFMDIPNLKIAVIAHGDYCDEEHFYVTQKVDFTNDLPTLSQFVKDVTGTGGGDWEECYELVLLMARTQLNWSPGTQRALVMIGDAAPHPVGLQSRNIDWRQEAQGLYDELGVTVYAVQCLSEEEATPFWQELAKIMHGRHIKLDQFGAVVDMIMAVVYREHDPAFFEAYEREVRNREGKRIRADLDNMLVTLRDGASGGASGVTLPSARGAAKKPRGRKAATANPRPRVSKAKKTTPAAGPSGASVVRKTKKNAKALTVGDRKQARKAGKANVAAKKKAVAKKQQRAPRQKKVFRESVPDSRFIFGHLAWSPWKLGMADKPPKQSKDWVERRGEDFGYRNKELFKDQKITAALYEVAVSTGPKRKKHTVYFRSTCKMPLSMKWDRRLLNRNGMRKQLDLCLKQGCLVYVRRAFLPSSGVTVNGKKCITCAHYSQMLKNHYDYAWRCSTGRKTHYRNVKKNGVAISDVSVQDYKATNIHFLL